MASFNIKSPDFSNGEVIPRKFTCEGEDLSPELQWENAPAGTKSYALVVEDPDAPMGTFVHWVLYDLPANSSRLERGVGGKASSDGFKQGLTDFGKAGWGGPCPPKGHGRHRYMFILRALDVPSIGVPPGSKKSAVEKAMRGHILAETKIMGIYQR